MTRCTRAAMALAAMLAFAASAALGQTTIVSGVTTHHGVAIKTDPGSPAPKEVSGFPVLIPNNSGSILGNSLTYPNVADLDGDGRAEIVVGRSDGTLFVVDSSGYPMPGFPKHLGPDPPSGDCIDQEPALADMDGDGDLEIIVGVDLGLTTRLWVFDHTGGLNALWPHAGVALDAILSFSPLAVDLNGDGNQDIIMGSSPFTASKLYALDRTGQSLPGFPVSYPVPGIPSATAAAADVLGGPLPELIFLGGDFKVHVLDSTGHEMPGWPNDFKGFRCVPAIGDLDGDGIKEIVLGEDNASGSSSYYAKVYVYEPNGSVRAGWPQATTNPSTAFLVGSPSLADLDGDGRLEILIAASDPWTNKDGSVQVWHDDGTVMAGWPQAIRRPASNGTNVTVGDVDADGVLDIATISHFDVQEISLFRPDGTMKPGFPYDLPAANNSMSSAVMADLNGDGDFEIVFTWFFNSCLGCPTSQYFSAIDAIELKGWPPQPQAPERPWGQFKQNAEHTGEAP